jgi:Mor family transcriptional regulator
MPGPEVKSIKDKANSKEQERSVMKKASSPLRASAAANISPSKASAAQKTASEFQTKQGARAIHNKYSAEHNGSSINLPDGGAKIKASSRTKNVFDELASSHGPDGSRTHGLEGLNINGDGER